MHWPFVYVRKYVFNVAPECLGGAALPFTDAFEKIYIRKSTGVMSGD